MTEIRGKESGTADPYGVRRGKCAVIALAGNPNVGKSTVFNALTGLKQHTGNWPGKTVGYARGEYEKSGRENVLIDLPGTYSLKSGSQEEEIARDFLLYGGADVCIVVCDATCIERNLNLVLQTAEVTKKVVLCINLMDEAEKKGIEVDIKGIERELGISAAATRARSGDGLRELTEKVEEVLEQGAGEVKGVEYPEYIEQAVRVIERAISEEIGGRISERWMALRMIEGDEEAIETAERRLAISLRGEKVRQARKEAAEKLREAGLTEEGIGDKITESIVKRAERVSKETVRQSEKVKRGKEGRLDKVLTGRYTGIGVMVLLLGVVFWVTIVGANYPSAVLTKGFSWAEGQLTSLFKALKAPGWLHGVLVEGVYRVVTWVVSVMLPPMAIFFPLFTVLEDFGYLPRVAFNMDNRLKKAGACGKQALTMCMGFGCNAAGVVGCRIIDSPREKLIAVLTNNFVPCNGRFPTIIAIITMFFVGSVSGVTRTVISAMILTAAVVIGIILTLAVSRVLSRTILKGEATAFTLELPPYRKPQIGRVIVRSMFDRTAYVLIRAVKASAPAGIVIWVLANVIIGEKSLLMHSAGLLEPFAQHIGMDGVILLAFILGMPANEIVVPIMIMAYLSKESIIELGSMTQLKELLMANGWTWLTAVCVMIFCMVHWPCATTCMTIKKETGSIKWAAVSFLLPTVIGLGLCFLVTTATRISG